MSIDNNTVNDLPAQTRIGEVKYVGHFNSFTDAVKYAASDDSKVGYIISVTEIINKERCTNVYMIISGKELMKIE